MKSYLRKKRIKNKMEKEDWFKLKDELIKLDIVARVDLRFFNDCGYSDYDESIRNWTEDIWMACPLGCVLNRDRITKLLDFRDRNNLEMDINNGEEIRFTERQNKKEDKK